MLQTEAKKSCQFHDSLIDIFKPQGPISLSTSMWSRSKRKRCAFMQLFVVQTEYESLGKCHLWGQILRAGTASGFNGLLFFKMESVHNYRPLKLAQLQQKKCSGIVYTQETEIVASYCSTGGKKHGNSLQDFHIPRCLI